MYPNLPSWLDEFVFWIAEHFHCFQDHVDAVLGAAA
jgi:hypothetical protein